MEALLVIPVEGKFLRSCALPLSVAALGAAGREIFV